MCFGETNWWDAKRQYVFLVLFKAIESDIVGNMHFSLTFSLIKI